MLAMADMSIATTSVYQHILSRYNWAEAVCVLIIFTIENVIWPISCWRHWCRINTYGRCQPSSVPHSGRSALCLWMCTGPLIYSLPLQWSYLYCTVVSQCNSPNCTICQLATCHVVNVLCVCHAPCDCFTVLYARDHAVVLTCMYLVHLVKIMNSFYHKLHTCV